jgi:hypothetical protein
VFRYFILTSSFLFLVLGGVVGAQQMISGDVNKFLKDGYTIHSTHALSDGFVYHLIKSKDLITCVNAMSGGKNTTVCFKP